MRILLLLSLFILLTSFFVRSQVTNYTFSETTGTYTAITGGTQLVTTTGGATSYDTDGNSITLPTSSQFIFNGTIITNVYMMSDGYLWLNPGITLANTTGVLYATTGPISSGKASVGVISAMGMDLRSTAITSQVYERRWQDNGTDVIFQWQNCARYLQSSSERFSFQIRINKSTGVVSIIYGNMTTIANSTSRTPMVGLRGSVNTDFNNRRLTNSQPDDTPNWGAPNGTMAGWNNAHTVRFTSNGSCFPSSGLTFIWTPPPVWVAYCTYNITNNDPTGITSVTFGTISNTSIGNPAYSDFTTQSTSVEQGGVYQLNVKVNTDGNWTVNTKAWVDWNQNYVFEVGEEYSLGSALNTTNGITSLSPLNITVPSGATLGETRMRIVSVEASDPVPLACGTQLYGEAEDYKLSIIPPTGLPVELLYFGGTVIDSRNVLLEWSTASEQSNDYFIIERSTDGYDWTQIKNIDGSGNSNTKINYTTIDNSAPRAIVYYKLSQVDFNGIYETFDPISVDLRTIEKDCDYKFYDLSGKLININDVIPVVYLRSCGSETIKIWKN